MSTQCTDDHDEGDFRAEFLGAVLVLKDDDARRDALLSGQALKGAKGMGNILAWILKLESPWDQCLGSLLPSHDDHKAVRYEILFEPYFALAHHCTLFPPPSSHHAYASVCAAEDCVSHRLKSDSA